jgi:hypothetical protein
MSVENRKPIKAKFGHRKGKKHKRPNSEMAKDNERIIIALPKNAEK